MSFNFILHNRSNYVTNVIEKKRKKELLVRVYKVLLMRDRYYLSIYIYQYHNNLTTIKILFAIKINQGEIRYESKKFKNYLVKKRNLLKMYQH